MKLILSRKGFDSGSGGAASPILPDGTLVSLPIPDGRSRRRYADIGDGSLGTFAADLSRGRVRANSPAHLDPDLDSGSVPRLAGWRGSLGQTGSARSHLTSAGVGKGDVFIFFGWFRDAALGVDGKWRFVPKGRSVHAMFGWMQVDEVLDLSDGDPATWRTGFPWLDMHPHVYRGKEPGNAVYVASETLQLGGRETGLPGYGVFRELTPATTLTDPAAVTRSVWRLPGWFAADPGRRPLTYHGDPARWTRDGGDVLLKTVGRGQEFVLDCETRPEADTWIEGFVSAAVKRGRVAA